MNVVSNFTISPKSSLPNTVLIGNSGMPFESYHINQKKLLLCLSITYSSQSDDALPLGRRGTRWHGERTQCARYGPARPALAASLAWPDGTRATRKPRLLVRSVGWDEERCADRQIAVP